MAAVSEDGVAATEALLASAGLTCRTMTEDSIQIRAFREARLTFVGRQPDRRPVALLRQMNGGEPTRIRLPLGSMSANSRMP
jgi:hypothetical protein